MKTGAALAFDEELHVLLEDYATALVSFGKMLDPSKHIVKLTSRIANPNIFIKDGSRLSKTAGDVDNTVKVIQDKLFAVMEFDDYICRHIDVADFPSNSYAVFITLEIKAIPCFQDVLSLVELDVPALYSPQISPIEADHLSSLD